MTYNPEIHHRRSIRLRGYEYSQAGAYFVTLCAWNKDCLFGAVVNGEMRLNEVGRIIAQEWARTPEIRKEIELAEFCIMPNHIHGIVTIHDVGANGGSPKTEGLPTTGNQTTGRSAESPLRMKTKSISSFIAGFKSTITKRINIARNTPGVPVWQRNYYEHIIRNDDELNRIREYIANNPLNWETDENNVGANGGSPKPESSPKAGWDDKTKTGRSAESPLQENNNDK